MARPKGSPKTPGSGRQKGQGVNKSSADTVKEWRDSGKPVPLQVMLLAMEEELTDPENVKLKRANRRAFPFAVAAAVYFHAKPQAATGWTPDPGAAAREIMNALREINDSVQGPPSA